MSLEQFRRAMLRSVYPVTFAGVFVPILVGYIVFTPTSDKIEATLPYADGAEILRSPERGASLVILGDGAVQLLWNRVDEADLVFRVQTLRYVPDPNWVIVSADSRMPYGRVKAVLGKLSEAGVSRVTLRTAKFASDAGQKP